MEVVVTQRRIAFISDHASPLPIGGSVDSGGQNVYVAQVALQLAARGFAVDVFTRRDRTDVPEVLDWRPGVRVVHVPAGPPEFVRKEDLLPTMRGFGGYVRDFCGAEGRYEVGVLLGIAQRVDTRPEFARQHHRAALIADLDQVRVR